MRNMIRDLMDGYELVECYMQGDPISLHELCKELRRSGQSQISVYSNGLSEKYRFGVHSTSAWDHTIYFEFTGKGDYSIDLFSYGDDYRKANEDEIDLIIEILLATHL